MPRIASSVLGFVVLLGLSGSKALAVGADHPPGKIAADYNREWPQGLPDLINSVDRVQGYWVNQGDFFYYRGDADALNKFLTAYSALSDTPLAVVIHAGAVPLTGPLGGEKTTRYDWKLEVMRRGWGVPEDPKRPASDPGYVVTVHVWLSDAVTLDRLEVPKLVEVRSAGDIERFIEKRSMNKGN